MTLLVIQVHGSQIATSEEIVAEWKIPHSTGFSGRQIASDGEGISTLDFPLIHDAWSQDQP